MSFYLGKDDSTNYILHTTNKQESEGAMKSGVLYSTTFHSSLPYLQILYEDTINLRKDTYSNQYGSWYRYSAMFSTESIDLILQGYLYSIIVNTANSGNQDCAIPGMSYSYVSPSFDERFPSYGWGPTATPYHWTTKYPSPSYINKYADVTFYSLAGNTVPNIMDSEVNDGLNSTTGRVVFYNIKNGSLITQPSTNKILITPSQFTITTPTQTIDMSNFQPFRVSNSYGTGAYKVNAAGNLYVRPITKSKFSTIKWEIVNENSSDCIINKYTSDGTKHQIIGNGARNLVLSSVSTFPYSVTATDNTVTSPGFVVLGSDEIATVIVDGSFYNAVVGTTYGNGVVPFVNNSNMDFSVSRVITSRVNNGQYSCDRYTLNVSVQNGVIHLKNSAARWCSGSAISGTFSGTLKVFIFKIR